MIKFLLNNKVVRLLKWIGYLKKNNYRRDTWYFILSYGIGDTYIASSFLPYLITRGDKVVALVTKESHHFIPPLFSPAVEVQVRHDLELELIEEFGQFGKGHPIILHPHNVLNGLLVKTLGYRQYNLADLYKLLLGVDLHLPPAPIVSVPEVEPETDALFARYSLPAGRTVLLCPSATSLAEIGDAFWYELASKLAMGGLTPVFMNSKAGGDTYLEVEFPLRTALSFCNRAGRVVSLRSGFCDLIATTTATTVILYPSQIWYSGPLIDSTNLKALGLSSKQNLLEISHDFAEAAPLHATILQYLT